MLHEKSIFMLFINQIDFISEILKLFPIGTIFAGLKISISMYIKYKFKKGIMYYIMS